ncbi:MAG: class I mannose-6-phosphate isomerase [Verrucomicrobiales bacterium]|nr:class I mannose-6-phosphate isomerase [Verrucomicrobiales bacterium]
MSTQAPSFLRFQPIYQSRVWGGRVLETRFGRSLPDGETPFGESWEISAREEADSEVKGGPLSGQTLRQLWSDPAKKADIFGTKAPSEDRFPLLFKILDARDKLSIQVHPPAVVAGELGGEPKTEVWYIAHAEPDAELYVGVEPGVTEASFRAALEDGTAEKVVHAIPVVTGQHIFIPSGRLHAIGAGLLIYEIQQNSDTTYRVYDWNRKGLDGKPRDLHIEESLKCIDFSDVSPGMDEPDGSLLSECEHFRLERHPVEEGESLLSVTEERFAVITVVSGKLSAGDEIFVEGEFFIVPASPTEELPVAVEGGAEVLLTTWPS